MTNTDRLAIDNGYGITFDFSDFNDVLGMLEIEASDEVILDMWNMLDKKSVEDSMDESGDPDDKHGYAYDNVWHQVLEILEQGYVE